MLAKAFHFQGHKGKRKERRKKEEKRTKEEREKRPLLFRLRKLYVCTAFFAGFINVSEFRTPEVFSNANIRYRSHIMGDL